MNMANSEYPNFEVNEDDLQNFEAFCDSKYKEDVIQKFGFFEVHLHNDVRRNTTLDEILQNFNGDAYKAVNEIIVIENPEDCGLYGHQSVSVPNKFREHFMETATADAFHMCNKKDNCCMESLEKGGTNAFTEHFFLELASKTVPFSKQFHQHKNLSSITRKISTWRAAFEKRQEFQKQDSVQGKSRVLELGMQLEKFDENNAEECHCSVCALMDIEVPPHPNAPLGCLYSSGIDESYEKHVKLTDNFSMIHLCYKNMLSMLDSSYPGVSFPAMYWGTKHTLFPLHVEDLSLWSFNFLLFGFPKFWIIVPPHSVAQLTDALARCGFGGVHKSCRNSLGHKFFVPNVSWLRAEGIPFSVVIQREGEGIVVLPNAAHSGGNLGHNVAQACNFGTERWIPYGCVYPACVCFDKAIHADLTPIIAVHRKDLLRAYINNNVINAVEDDYFLKSVVVPRREQYEETKSETTSSSIIKSEEKTKCPVCPYSWKTSIQKRHVMSHLNKYHAHLMKDARVEIFLREKFP